MAKTTDIKNAPVGVFDSGIGGITVLRELLRECPNENFIYIGDDVNSPYGTRPAEEIQQLSLDLIKHPKLQGTKALVIACNTITAAAYDAINQNYEGEVIGVIQPGVDAVLKTTTNNKVGILATHATVNSGVHERALKNANPEVEVTSVGAPKMHAYAEDSLDLVLNNPTPEIRECVKEYVQPFIDAGCDTILLACTHFPPYESLIREVVGPSVNIISPSKNTAEALRASLEANGLQNTNPANPNFEIISTAGNDEKYAKFSELILR